MLIQSLQNPFIKHLKFLRDKKERQATQEFLVEGFREISSAIRNNFVIAKFVYCKSKLSDQASELMHKVPRHLWVEVPKHIFEKVAIRVNTGGILGVFKIRTPKFDFEKMTSDQNLIVLDGIEKPGNLGAILRTADATAVPCLIIVNSSLDIFNPNVIRASLGTTFSVPCISMTTVELVKTCSKNQIPLVALTPYGSKSYLETNFPKKSALVFGSEANGVTEELTQACQANIHLPMQGQVDSLNLSVSGGVLMYHLVSLRSKNH